MRALILAVTGLFLIAATTEAKADVPMPQKIVLVLCKVQLAQAQDPNAGWTGHIALEWVFEGSKMACRREVVQVEDGAVLASHGRTKASPQPFNEQRCQRASITMMAGGFGSYRVFRVACPTPTVRYNPDGSPTVVAWTLPDCGMRGLIHCEKDSVI